MVTMAEGDGAGFGVGLLKSVFAASAAERVTALAAKM
jgi:hypothetical protein